MITAARSTGDRQHREAQADREQHMADTMHAELLHWEPHLTAKQVEDIRARIGRHTAAAMKWRES